MKPDSSSIGRPFKPVLYLMALVLLVISGRLFELQILKGDYYRELSSRNHIRSVITQAPRGTITDRNGIVLADNEPSFTISLVSAEFDSSNAELLGELLNMDMAIVHQRLQVASERQFRSTVVASGMNVQQAGRVADNLYRLGGVSVDVLPRRRYPLGSSFCHLVGYVGLADSVGVFEGEITGRTGLERILNQRLTGKHGVAREVVDAYGRVVERFEGAEVAPVEGESVILTLDSRIQLAADSLIRSTGYPGAAVVINYETGEILCLSSIPGYEPNLFVGGISSDEWNGVLNDPDKPLLNRSWATAYPPGSTFKIVTSAWLLESRAVTANYMPDPCYGTFRYGGSDFRCWSIHGRLNIVQAIARSCDSYFYRTTMHEDIDEMAAFADRFGLGRRVTEILPAEAAGLIPSREILNSLFGRGGWGQGNLMIASIGQGEVMATPLQIAVVSGLLASGFRMPALSIILGEVPDESPWGEGVSDETLDIIREGMLQVVESRNGTLHSTFGSFPVQVWAKSGTAESGFHSDHAWVTGYIAEPVPIAFSVLIEEGGHGSQTAGPVAAGLVGMIVEEFDEAQ